MRVDEKLQHHLSQDLRKAFSLNDRFRFKRALFNNDDETMNNIIRQVEGMSSAEEARDFFLRKLGWDENNTDVADFLHIVCSRFA